MEKLWRRTDSCRSATTGLNIYIYRKYSKLQFRLFEEGGVYVMGTGLEAKTQQGATNKWSAAAEPQTSPNSSLLSFLLSPLLSLSFSLSLLLARSLAHCPQIDWPFSACDGDVLWGGGVARCGKLVDEWAFGMLALDACLPRYSLCVCDCSNAECMQVCAYVCVRACMNTMPRLCRYRMELWPLSRQHSCAAIGLGVHGSSRRLGDNNPLPSPSPQASPPLAGSHNAPLR